MCYLGLLSVLIGVRLKFFNQLKLTIKQDNNLKEVHMNTWTAIVLCLITLRLTNTIQLLFMCSYELSLNCLETLDEQVFYLLIYIVTYFTDSSQVSMHDCEKYLYIF